MVERDASGVAARSRARKHRRRSPGSKEPGCSRAFADGRRRTARLADTLARVSHLALHLEGPLAELDINPLMVLPSGQGSEGGRPRRVPRHVVVRNLRSEPGGYGWRSTDSRPSAFSAIAALHAPFHAFAGRMLLNGSDKKDRSSAPLADGLSGRSVRE
jgi:hypothetical protein